MVRGQVPGLMSWCVTKMLASVGPADGQTERPSQTGVLVQRPCWECLGTGLHGRQTTSSSSRTIDVQDASGRQAAVQQLRQRERQQLAADQQHAQACQLRGIASLEEELSK